ncbi:multidrug ABC transporter ATP-binding protein [Pseudoalteromonas sp. A25]|uniref:ABC transporter ATP-binding protein n=1 Tax=Pseudoalteromonas sp. A25 TaxID=116092 RepID=UPI0012610816|nr:ATP-binding cassette domain-containing protein [Pseudoalteromonas sp. A25]BBN80993.1 multidrug ABC transporter ATP-binding protein [Pseudoalteromonas sp. A25]
MIEINSLNKQYADKLVFRDYCSQFTHQKTCVTGENGLGKTSLFAIIAGLDPHFSGQIFLSGKRVTNLQTHVALASDRVSFPSFLTSRQVLLMTNQAWQCEMPLSFAEELGFTSFLDTRVAALSSGNNKKLQLLNAIMRGTEYLILDEPSAALDKHGIDVICQWLSHYQGHVLISSHEPKPFLSIGFVSQPLFSQK